VNESIQQIGPYTVETEIGRGGMGVVFRAADAGGDLPVCGDA